MTASAEGPAPSAWPVLSPCERRVLGVLVEKAKTTPDAYPMSLNSLVTGCNQKNNRDPVMNLDDVQVEDALQHAQTKQFAVKIVGGGRIDRWRHALYDVWKVNKVELAILGELLLRGPQTEGELRGRASRMEPIDDLDTLRTVLRVLTQRGLVVYLTPEGRRGTILTHGFHSPQELEHWRRVHGSAASEPADSERPVPADHRPAPARSDLERQLADARAEIADLRSQMQALQSTVADLATRIDQLKSKTV